MATSTMAAPTVQTQSMVGGGEVGRMRVVLALRQELGEEVWPIWCWPGGLIMCDDNVIIKQSGEDRRGGTEKQREREGII